MTTKLKYILFAFTLTFWVAKAQHKKLKKANESFEHFEYSNAIQQYEVLVSNGTTSPEIYRNLGDANYLNSNYSEAATWYGKMADMDEDALDSEHLYRYASSLRAIQQYEASEILLKKLSSSDSDMILSTGKFMTNMAKRFGSYSIENIAINSPASDFAPSFRLDGLVFSTGRDTSEISNVVHNWNKKRFLSLYMATTKDDGSFQNIMGFSDKLNTKLHESSTAFSKDGMTVYFTRNKEKGNSFGRDAKGVSRLKLYCAVHENGKWTKIKALPFNKNGYSVAHPTLNSAEDRLYFASDMEGTVGQSDIFVVDIHTDGSFGEPQNLSKRINTGGRETFPFVTEDDILYFASDGHAGLGGLDVFAVDLKAIETSAIVNLGEPVNSTNDDFSFIINNETKKGYFASNRADGKGDDDIYALTELKPLDTRCFSELLGVVRDKETGAIVSGAKVILIDENGDLLADTLSNDEGFFSMRGDCSANEFVVVASKETYEKYSTSVQNNRTEVLPNITMLLAGIDLGAPIGTDLTKYLNINPVYFDLNNANIREDARLVLEQIITYLNTYPQAKIEVRSHTDSRGGNHYNQDLSKKRAEQTVAYLLTKGIEASRIFGKGFGESQLLNECDNNTKCRAQEHRLNRRSEFIIVEK